MSRRATLDQAHEDLQAARERVEETYYEWAGQLAREAASDALALVEEAVDVEPPQLGEIGQLEDRIEGVVEAGVLDPALAGAGRVLDEVLDPTLEPEYDPGLARREGGSEDYTTREDAREAIEAAESIVQACEAVLDTDQA